MKRISTLLFFCAAVLSWNGCSKDDDNSVDPAQLTGTWEVTKEYDAEFDEWDEEFGEAFGYISTKEFRNDGTCTFRYEERDPYYVSEVEFSYKVESGILTITELSTGDREFSRIEKLTASEFIIAYDYEGDDGRKYTDREFHKRIR